MPLAAVESVLKQSHPERLQVVALALAGRIPPEGHEWLRFLAAYLADCSPEDAELLAQAIRAARAAIGG